MSSRGSVWRQWDLHIHTPASFLWRGERLSSVDGDKRIELLDRVLDRLIEVDTAAFAIMDYWTFDGYLGLKERIEARGGVGKRVFPGMEIRCESPADFRLNMHVLLSDLLTDQQLADFKSSLILVGTDRRLSDEGLGRVAMMLTPDKQQMQGIDPKRLDDPQYARDAGAKVALVKRDSLYAAVRDLPRGTALIMAPWETYGGVQGIKLAEHPVVVSEIMANADIWETRRSFFVDLFRGRETAKNKRFLEHFLQSIGGKGRPSVSGSDAHRVASYGTAPEGRDGDVRRTWIKADTSFEGLRQTLNEPATRVHIGTVPDEHRAVSENPTLYIDRVRIWKEPDSTLEEEWFDADIPLNPFLVAIIGNKGSGKSALLDIIGLLGQSRAVEHFSFLNSDRFRSRRGGKARSFRGELVWRDGAKQTMGLADLVDPAAVERVKYVPQSYLESVCNEVDLRAGGRFRTELESVIFSHVPPEDRLGYSSLQDLVSHKVRQTDDRIAILRGELSSINLEIEGLEDQARPSRRAEIAGEIGELERVLLSIDGQKPIEVEEPSRDKEDEATRLLREDVEEALLEFGLIQLEVSACKSEVASQTSILDKLREVNELVINLTHQVKAYKKRLELPLKELGISYDDVVTFDIDLDPLDELESDRRGQLAAARSSLEPGESGSAVARLQTAQEELNEARAKLEGPQRMYIEYLAKLEDWNRRREVVIGGETTEGSLRYAQANLKALDEIPARLTSANGDRLRKVREIFGELEGLRCTYEELYAPVQEFAREHSLLAERFRPEFSVRLDPGAFREDFLSKISRSRAGSFYGEAGSGVVEALVEDANFDDAAGVVEFLLSVFDRLAFDRRDSQGGVARRVAEQVRNDVSPHSVYDYICGLSYLKPEYRLELHGKGLGELSPGERGTLLLMFYLLVDRSRIPLLIDQPEENLDNQTVFSLVGQCIREAKKRRQVIIVTHNPNLAVACDAEQVICASRSSDGTNRVEYVSGAIEDPEINAALLQILEGTQPAFDNRESKYQRSRD